MIDAELRPLVADKAGRVLRALLRYAAGHHDLRDLTGR